MPETLPAPRLTRLGASTGVLSERPDVLDNEASRRTAATRRLSCGGDQTPAPRLQPWGI